MTLFVAKNEIPNQQKHPSQNKGVHSQLHQSLLQVCSKDKQLLRAKFSRKWNRSAAQFNEMELIVVDLLQL